MSGSISVVSWGIGGRPVDLGRPGRAHLGVSRGGAIDVAALRLGNRLVGNPESGGGIESSGGLTLHLHDDAMVAVTGAIAEVSTDGPPIGWGSPVVMRAGTTLRVERILDGVRAYVAVRGGLVADGDRLLVGPDPRTPASSSPAVPMSLPMSGPGRVRLWPGPRLDWFEPRAWNAMCSTRFPVLATSRVGVRLGAGALDGPLERVVRRELPSEGLVEGAVQVPPDGAPIVMLADHPTTGGYPVIAVVDPEDLGIVAQAAPGSTITFVDARARR